MRTFKINGQSVIIYSLFALLFSTCIWATIHTLKPVNTNEYQIITVHSGDTLWGIAENYKGKQNVNEFVSWVEDVNKVQSGHIKVGDRLVIPIKKNIKNDTGHLELASK